MATYSFQYPSRLESEDQMLDDFESAFKDSNIDLNRCRGFMLAASEAFTNAMVHGNSSSADKQVKVRLEVNENTITADILDEGRGGLDRLRARKPRGLMAEGGRGIDLIGHYADTVEYSQHSTGGLNVRISIDRKKVQQTIQKLSEDNMEMIVREKGPVTVVQLSGRLDLASGSSLKEQVKKLLAKNETTVHLNLAHVEFINSSGLGALVSIMKEVRLAKGRLTLSNLASYVQEIFDITQLSHIFEIYSTEEEALASFQAASVR